MSSTFYREALKRNQTEFVQRLNVDNIIDDLRANKLISEDEYETVMCMNAVQTRARARKLIEFLLLKRNEDLEKFLIILEENGYDDLSARVRTFSEEAKKPDSQQIDQLFIKGGVPDYRRLYKAHPREQEIQESIKKLFDDYKTFPSAFLVVQGVAGIGKTLLVSQAIRQHEILLKYYPDGVSWQSLGQLRNRDYKELEEHLIGILMSISISLALNVPENRSRKLSSLLDAFRVPLIDRKVLLIFDDVWDKVIVDRLLKHIPAKMLITTRNAALFAQCGCVQHFALNPIDDFEKSKELMAVSDRKRLEGKDQQLKDLLKHCQGIPLAIRMVGSLYEQYYGRSSALLQLEKDLSTGRILRRHLNFPNDYNSIQETFAVSLIDLHREQHRLNKSKWVKNPNFLDKYLVFAGMNADLEELITGDDVKVLWGQASADDAEDILGDLAERGLLIEQQSTDQDRHKTFRIPKLQLLFLKEFVKGTEGLLGGRVDRWENRKSKENGPKNYADFYVYYPYTDTSDSKVDGWIIDKLLPAVEDSEMKGFFHARDSAFGTLTDPTDAICSVDKVLVVLTNSLAAWRGLEVHLSLMTKTAVEQDRDKVVVVQYDADVDMSQLAQLRLFKKFDFSGYQEKPIDDESRVKEMKEMLKYRSSFMETLRQRMEDYMPSYDD